MTSWDLLPPPQERVESWRHISIMLRTWPSTEVGATDAMVQLRAAQGSGQASSTMAGLPLDVRERGKEALPVDWLQIFCSPCCALSPAAKQSSPDGQSAQWNVITTGWTGHTGVPGAAPETDPGPPSCKKHVALLKCSSWGFKYWQEALR